ncbi:MAG: hypothetical protein KF873_17825 [Gemmataceae bacterium]|nr:hypothetical protein [Gemmataceae bacterium]
MSKSFTDHALDRMKGLYLNHDDEAGSKYVGADAAGKKRTDCITYVRKVISYAYEQTGQAGLAKEIWHYTEGMPLARYLVRLGWKAYYWSPDTDNPKDGDKEHPYTYKVAIGQKKYYDMPVIGTIVNYAPHDAGLPNWIPVLGSMGDTKLDPAALLKLQNIRFAFGIARGAMHTFLFSAGDVYEVHWRDIGANLYGKTPLQNYDWLSGALVLPP